MLIVHIYTSAPQGREPGHLWKNKYNFIENIRQELKITEYWENTRCTHALGGLMEAFWEAFPLSIYISKKKNNVEAEWEFSFLLLYLLSCAQTLNSVHDSGLALGYRSTFPTTRSVTSSTRIAPALLSLQLAEVTLASRLCHALPLQGIPFPQFHGIHPFLLLSALIRPYYLEATLATTPIILRFSFFF